MIQKKYKWGRKNDGITYGELGPKVKDNLLRGRVRGKRTTFWGVGTDQIFLPSGLGPERDVWDTRLSLKVNCNWKQRGGRSNWTLTKNYAKKSKIPEIKFIFFTELLSGRIGGERREPMDVNGQKV